MLKNAGVGLQPVQVNATCLRQSGFERNGTVDRHIVGGGGVARADLHTAFSWRGFRHVQLQAALSICWHPLTFRILF